VLGVALGGARAPTALRGEHADAAQVIKWLTIDSLELLSLGINTVALEKEVEIIEARRTKIGDVASHNVLS
jgi:hypothetical protein